MTPTTPDFTWLFLKMVLGLVLVLGLAIILLRFVLPRTAMGRLRRGGGGLIQILDRVLIEQGRSLMIVKIVGRYFVLGVSNHAVNAVAELSQTEGEKLEKG